jgi:uncharacterized protein YndB with AHSA1/START domain
VSNQHNEATQAASKPRELLITRVFDAPRTLVFQAWIKPEHLAHWWGPRGYSLPSCEMDARAGGAYRFRMHASDGRDVTWQGICREIVEPERLVWTCTILNPDGSVVSSETILTVTLEDLGAKTRLTLHQAVFDSDANAAAHRSGWTEALERMAAYLPKAA